MLSKPKKTRLGICPLCAGPTLFISRYDWLRDHYLCIRCRSIPRQRALVFYLKRLIPDFRTKIIHESSPGGSAFSFFKSNCKYYSFSHYLPEVRNGSYCADIRCENLESLTFPDNTFDIFITQDVLEHIINPNKALQEIKRVLKPGGIHIFTVPIYAGQQSAPRIVLDGAHLTYIKEPVYHGNPISEEGSLVTYDWGLDILELIEQHCDMKTHYWNNWIPSAGVEAEFLHVFVSTKSLED